ncbi:GntR family transcriptional regulator [Pseudorhodoferax sp. LjRoot39]|uniref:GntR family transcriptional regulator n=1 Tax=Pseudorhodoferax sp. LjRoot39 TaxID=3342328 RepID=UPI003ECEFEDA
MRTASRKASKKPPTVRDESSVERLYYELRDRAMRYDFKPGSRINEKGLSEELGVARATLREALNRLSSEGLFEFVLNKGFFRKAISVDEVFDLYQVRIALERRAVHLAVLRASDADIAAVKAYWVGVMQRAQDLSTGDLVLADEEFHRRLVALSQNKELVSFAEMVTRRIHVARHIDIEQLSAWNLKAFDAHINVIDLVAHRRTEEALQVLTEHIDVSLKRAVEIAKEMVSRFFLVDASTSLRAAGATPQGGVALEPNTV